MFGRLTVINEVSHLPNRDRRYLCKCSCGGSKTTSAANLRTGTTRSCGCLNRESGPKRRIHPGCSSENSVVSGYIRDAARRGLSVAMSRKELGAILRKPCHYCGKPPAQKPRKESKSNYVCGGIDRVDSAQGYVVENVVPACFVCNRAKFTMPVGDFLKWVVSVYAHSIQNKETERCLNSASE